MLEQNGYLIYEQKYKIDCGLKCVKKKEELLKMYTTIAIDDIYQKLLQVMKHGYTILNLKKKI